MERTYHHLGDARTADVEVPDTRFVRGHRTGHRTGAPIRKRRFRRLTAALLVGLTVVLAVPQGAFASNGPHYGPSEVPRLRTLQQSPGWVLAKMGYRVWSGIEPGQGKGTHTHPVVLSASMIGTSPRHTLVSPNAEFPPVPGAPLSSILNVGPLQEYISEPSNGYVQNYPGTGNTADDAGHHYFDNLYYSWCGVGASDLALWYWPNPQNNMNSYQVSDPMAPGQYSSWNGKDIDNTYRLRGYMSYLANQVKAPGWMTSGMLPQSFDQSGEKGGITLQVAQDALNWEASGHNSSNWSTYFYLAVWNSRYYGPGYPNNLYNALHKQIVVDIAHNHVPVLVELPAGYLPNWPHSATVYHMVAIVGYDDTTNTYYYIDTCKAFTNCNLNGIDSPDAHPVNELQLEQGVASIPTNQTTGDGGWVW